jgi:hypothetical protein
MSDPLPAPNRIGPGELCPRRLRHGDVVTGVCLQCGHLDYLHSSDRPCAGCEAIAEAMRIAAELARNANDPPPE